MVEKMGCLKLHITEHKLLPDTTPSSPWKQNPKGSQNSLSLCKPFDKTCAGSYRFGFQGQETDDEIKGNGNSINYTFRMHDSRLGRFLSIDPLTKKYPMYSSYHFSSNQPIHASELEGLESELDLNAKAGLTCTIGTKGQSSVNFAAGIGIYSTNGHSMTGANLSLNLSSGGFGSSHVSTGKSSFNGMLTLGLSYTKGRGEGTPTDLNIFTSNTVSGITNNFKSSFTIGTNISYNNATGLNRAWGVATKSGGFTTTLNEDVSLFTGGHKWWKPLPTGYGILGSGYDQDNTGGGFLGYTFKNGTSAYLGTEIFTGKPLTYPKSGEGGYVLQTPSQQAYNTGRSFLKIENNPDIGNLRLDYQGQSQMWSQNTIHDLMGIERFKSTAPNSLLITR